MQVDVVVVGAGHNGLVAANVLADAGLSVLVLEASPRAGGAVASTHDEIAPGFTVDLFSAFYPLGAASPAIRSLGLEDYGLRWSRPPVAFAHHFPDGRLAKVCADAADTADSLEAFAAGDGDRWLEQVAGWARVRDDVLDALMTPFPPVRPVTRLARSLGVADTLRLARLGAATVRRWGEETFDGDGARALFTGNALHSDLSPEAAGSAVFGWLLTMLAQDVGFPVPTGGAGALVDALVARLLARGGRLETSTPVTKVVVESGRATGVVADGIGPVGAAVAVLADVAAPHLFLDLVGAEHLPARMVRDLTKFQWDTPTIKLNWALSAPIPWTDPSVVDAGTVHLGVDIDGFTRFSADLACREAPEHPFVLLGQMTTADPSRSPAGTSSVWAYSHLPHGRTSDGDVERQVERIEAAVQALAPGFGSGVIARQVQGPGDLQAVDRALVHGSLNGGTASLHQQLVFRPTPGLGRAETPVDRLLLAGSAAHPGGGVHGGCGWIAARSVLRRRRIGGEVAAAGVRRALSAAIGR